MTKLIVKVIMQWIRPRVQRKLRKRARQIRKTRKVGRFGTQFLQLYFRFLVGKRGERDRWRALRGGVLRKGPRVEGPVWRSRDGEGLLCSWGGPAEPREE